MKNNTLFALFSVFLLTTACHSNNPPKQTPIDQKPRKEQTQPIPTTPPDMGVLFDQNQTTRLFTKSTQDGLLDFKLYSQNKRSGTIKEIPLPTSAIITGAAIKDNQHIFVAVNQSKGTEDSKSSIYQIKLTSNQSKMIFDSDNGDFSGIEFNSLTFKDNKLRFFGLKPHQYDDHDEAHDSDHSHWMNKLTLYTVDPQNNQASSVQDGTKEEQEFSQLFIQANNTDFPAQRLLAQGKKVRPFLRFPKALASRHVPGSPYHKGRDLYALDLNRGGGNDDMNDGAVVAASGQVILSKYGGRGYGHFIIIRHIGGYYTLYAHLNKRVVHTGQRVYQGQYIGNIGRSGGQKYAHLHFVFYKGRTPLRVASAKHPMQASYGNKKCPITYFPKNTYVKMAKCP